jgi:peptidoglycan/xylan/chitin deacetylase (PgdA/CDA1 family)
MRSVLSYEAWRTAVVKVRSSSVTRLRAAAALTLLVTLALVMLAMAPASSRRAVGAPGRSTTPSGLDKAGAEAAASRPPGVNASGFYRLAGCSSRGDFVYRHGPSRREVAIGFDDGPAPDTGAFVRMLERNHVPATFFVIGAQLKAAYAATLRRELHDGDALGDHTFTHPNLLRSGGVRAQLLATIGAIRSLSGYTPCVFRPPYGAYDRSVILLARSLGLATILWNVDPRDWSRPGRWAILRRVLAEVRPGSIIVSHDGGGPRGQTLAAYPSIISSLRARGYRIVTIPELLGFHPVYAPCPRPCHGIGVPGAKLPRGAIIAAAR